MSEDAYQAQLHMMRMGVQRKHLIGTDIVTCCGLLNLFESYLKKKGDPHDDMMTRLIGADAEPDHRLARGAGASPCASQAW